MSTKTTFKRISLVTVAALGLGVLTSVSANAATVTAAYTYTASGTATDSTTPVEVGTAITLTPTVTITGTTATSVTPLSTVFVLKDPNGTDVTSTATCTAGANVTGHVTSISVAAGTCTFASSIAAGANRTGALGTILFTPTMGGKYQLFAGNAVSTTADNEISAVTSAAATGTTTNFVHVSGARVSQGTTRGATGAAQAGSQAKVDITFPTHTGSEVYTIKSSGVGAIVGGVATTGSTTNISGVTTDYSQGLTYTNAASTALASELLTLSSAVNGTQKITVSSVNATSGVLSTLYTIEIVWGAAPVVTSATAKLAAGNDCSAGAASSVYLSKTAGVTLAAGATTGASLCLTVKDQNGTAMNGVPLDVTIAGPGLVRAASNTTTALTGTTRTASLSAITQAATSTAAIGISADGTAGTGVVTVSTGTTVLATATVYFYGAAASISATQVLKVASSSGATLGVSSAAPTGADSANSPAVIVSVKDKDGILIPGLTTADIKATSSNTAVMSEALALTESTGAGAGNTTAKTYNVAVTSVSNTSGKSATLTFKVLGADGVTYVSSAPITFTLGGSVATVALSLDKASYSIGSAAVATLTAKDSSGNAAKDGVLAATLADKLLSSYSVNKDLFGTSVDFIGGVATVSFNAPVITGAWTISGTTGTGPSTDKAKALTASATVTGGNDAAIASLISKINALSKLIAKIQKKLGIK